ncbi:MAG: hypothetical protein RL660_2647 [Bacteroidota bacterium]|jgi:hypothetical protein
MFNKLLLQKIFLVMLMSSVAVICKADCTSSGIDVFPRSVFIAPNSIFIVQGYAESQTLIENLNGKNPIYLRAGSDTVPLIVQTIIRSPYALTQAICKPARKLLTKRIYQLVIDNITLEGLNY